jgi:hypothetical protein
MVRDLWILAAVSIAFSVIVWAILGNSPLRTETSHSLNADPDLRLISERSPFMRTER